VYAVVFCVRARKTAVVFSNAVPVRRLSLFFCFLFSRIYKIGAVFRNSETTLERQFRLFLFLYIITRDDCRGPTTACAVRVILRKITRFPTLPSKSPRTRLRNVPLSIWSTFISNRNFQTCPTNGVLYRSGATTINFNKNVGTIATSKISGRAHA